MKYVLILPFLLLPAYGQIFSFGVKAGAVSAGGVDSQGFAFSASEAKPYTVGPAFEFRLPFRLAAEADALYSRTGYRGSYCRLTYCGSESAHANVFTVPMLLKYRVHRAHIPVFAAGGVSYRRVGEAHGNAWSWRSGQLASNEVVDYTIHQARYTDSARNGVGFVAAGGLEFKTGIVKFTPEFRYTRWRQPAWSLLGSGGGYYSNGSSLNQFDVLFGVIF
jgi:hypothetical protein